MKSFFASLIMVFASCSVQLPEEKKDKNTPTADPKPTEVSRVANPTKDICSYNKDPDKGCLKAAISGSELYVGDFFYDIGVKAFARQFDTDLGSSEQMSLSKTESLEFAQRVTVQNFYSNFSVSIEGSHTVYSAVHTGLGNLQVNSMAPGFYSILVAKDFDLKVVTAGSTTGYKCAVVWARRMVEIASGQETPLPETIAQFELEVFNESCSGRSKVKASEEVGQ